jgi:hypothetical protein
VPIDATLENQLEELPTAGLPGTIQLTEGLLTIRCNDMEDLLRQLVLLAKMADSDYEHLRGLIEATVPRRSPASKPRRWIAIRAVLLETGAMVYESFSALSKAAPNLRKNLLM